MAMPGQTSTQLLEENLRSKTPASTVPPTTAPPAQPAPTQAAPVPDYDVAGERFQIYKEKVEAWQAGKLPQGDVDQLQRYRQSGRTAQWDQQLGLPPLS